MSCPLCESHTPQFYRQQSGYTIVQCRNCTLFYLDPMPDQATLTNFYQQESYYAGESTGYADYDATRKVLEPLADRRLRLLESLVNKRSILDVGCAAGFFLNVARQRGWKIAGMEVAQGMARRTARDLGIPIASSLDEVTTPPSGFDVITLWEVIEHLPQPYQVLKQIYGQLRPGGVLALSTPNNGHWQAMQRPEQWQAYRPPAHVIFFTAPTLQALLERVGFTKIVIRRSGPLPAFPGALDRLVVPLQRSLANGNARYWHLALWTWRLLRMIAMGYQRLNGSTDDIYMTLEVTAIRP